MTRPLFILFFALTCLAGAADKAESALNGRWTMTGKSDKPIDTDKFQIEWEITPTEIIVRDRKHNEEVSRNKYSVDATKSPAWITVSVAGPSPETRLGIFRVRGNELHLKQQIGAGERPTKFGESYSVLRRAKTTKRNLIQ